MPTVLGHNRDKERDAERDRKHEGAQGFEDLYPQATNSHANAIDEDNLHISFDDIYGNDDDDDEDADAFFSHFNGSVAVRGDEFEV